jgi:hypothetical protein
MRSAAVASCIAGLAIAAPSSDVVDKFNEFQAKWGRNYVGDEYAKRIQHFADHMEHVKKWQDAEVGTATYTYLGPFADASPEEMSKMMGLKAENIFEVEQMPSAPFLNRELDSSLDWVAKGAVNPIKNQASCGSCWAFSTACTLEGVGFVTSGKLVSVSEQNIVDCDSNDDGCNGGLPSRALQWSSNNGGVASESAYRYTARDGSCRSGVSKIIHNQGYQRVSQNEDQIAQALAQYGPLSIAVDANGFSGYNGGVLQNPSCSTSGLNHAINIVGYGTSGIQYWKVRNSWGTSFGESGYIRMARGNCQCGLCRQVVYPTGVTVGGSGPTPPGPSPSPPGPSPSPPGPSPCHQCQWNSDCPSGEDCYYPSSSASHGCCSAGPPFLGAKKHPDGYCTWHHNCPGPVKEDWWCSWEKSNCHECHGTWCDGNSTLVV